MTILAALLLALAICHLADKVEGAGDAIAEAIRDTIPAEEDAGALTTADGRQGE